MAKRDNQKLKILYLLKILCEHSSKGQALTMPEIIKELSDKYSICAERKSIYSDLDGLRTFGIDVVGEKNGKTFSYYIDWNSEEKESNQIMKQVMQIAAVV